MKNVLKSIARALRAMLASLGAVMRRLLGLPDPGPDIEFDDVPDVGLDAVTQSDVGETYSETLARRIREAAALRLRGADYAACFTAEEGYEAAWIGRLETSQLERIVRMPDADILAHVSGERVVPGLLPVLRMRWAVETHIPMPAADPEPDPHADTGLSFGKRMPKAKATRDRSRDVDMDGRQVEMIEIGVEAVFAAWKEKMAREAAEERDAA